MLTQRLLSTETADEKIFKILGVTDDRGFTASRITGLPEDLYIPPSTYNHGHIYIYILFAREIWIDFTLWLFQKKKELRW